MEIENIEDLAKERLAELSLNMFHQIMVHHTIYFMEVAHQFGMEKALEIMKNAWPTSYRVQMRRLSKTLGFEMENNIPRPLLDMPRDDLLALIKGLGANWLAGDGIWFQSVEKELSMPDAQRCAGCAIMKYCAFEAWSIKQFMGLPALAGLEGLKKGLRFRLYHQINTQTIIDEKPDSVV
ncbi:MAG: cytosolic protein, partial [Deltaproteobacteria bacterium]|nr:cytosolic protein [Deltaproteobacteria bacterium]